MKNKTFIIAEIGVNHNGSISLAKKIIKKLSKLEIDAVKIQAYSHKNLASPETFLAEYQKKNVKNFKNQYEMLKKYELSKKQIEYLYEFSKNCGIELISSVFSIKDFEKIENLPKKIIKIPSGEFTNFELIDYGLKNYQKIILSTGLSDISEIKNTLKKIKRERKDLKGISILHCTSSYPCPDEDVDILSLHTMNNTLNVEIGYSDHTVGSVASIMSVALGAKIIEKHVTLDKTFDGPDHKASSDIKEFTNFVGDIRRAEKMIGNGEKLVQKSAKKNIEAVKKSIYVNKEILKGEKFLRDSLEMLRPAKGLNATYMNELIGKKATRNYKPGEVVSKKEI